MNKIEKISREALLDYMSHEQVAFQFSDGLINFTHPDCNYVEEDFEREASDEMFEYVKEGKSFKIVTPLDVISRDNELGFNEFAEWSLAKDLLIQVDKNLLLCLPNYSNYHEVFYTEA